MPKQKIQRRARRRVSASRKTDPALVFDIGKSRGSDIAKEKDAMIAEAIAADVGRNSPP